MKIRPKTTSWKTESAQILAATWALLAGVAFFFRLEYGCFPRKVLHGFLLAALSLVAFSFLFGHFLVWLRNRERRKHWEIDDSGIRMFRDGELLESVPWNRIKRISFGKRRLSAVCRAPFAIHSLRGVDKPLGKRAIEFFERNREE